MENSKPNHPPCPQCAKHGRAVKDITLRSLLREEFRSGIEGKTWQFCTTPKCPIVYFDSGGSTFHKDQLTVRVGIKETTSPRPVCYCFDHTVEEIEDDIARSGKTGVLDDIKTRMKEACWCETTSPMGGCCLATVNGFIKDSMNRHGQSMPTAVSSAHDCCAVNVMHGKPIPATDRRGLWAGIGAVLAAIASSACCWLPLVLLAFGASAVGVASFFEAWRPWFLTGAAVLLACGFYLSYFRKTSCQPGDACAAPSPRLRRMNRAMLWIAAVFVAAFALFPNYLGLLLRDPSADTPPTSADKAIVLTVQGMTCEACAIGIEKSLVARPDIAAVHVDYQAGKVSVFPADGHTASKASIAETIRSLGYRVDHDAQEEVSR
jgi:copper chaperone CopZ